MNGTAHIVVAMKPLEGSFSQNALSQGVSGLWIDGGRVETDDTLTGGAGGLLSNVRDSKDYPEDNKYLSSSCGRWPANVILGHTVGCSLVGTKRVKSDGHYPSHRGKGGLSTSGHSGQGGLEERHTIGELAEDWDCGKNCPVVLMDEQSGTSKSSGGVNPGKMGRRIYGHCELKKIGQNAGGLGDEGGVSRFFKQIGEYDEENADKA